MGVPQNGWFIGKIQLKWMMTGGTPIYGNPHIPENSTENIYIYCENLAIHWSLNLQNGNNTSANFG